MAKSLIDLCNFKVTVPLSEKTKNIHTNSFIYFEPLKVMEYSNLDFLYEEMGKTRATRWVPYRKGYWYVKGVKIIYSNTEQKMELTLSPFPTVFQAEKLQATNKTTNGGDKNANNTTSSRSTNAGGTASNITIKAPSWLNKTDKQWAETTVKKAIGSTRDRLKQAKNIYNYFKDHYSYSKYPDLRYTSPKGNRKSAFERGYGNCADGANILETLFLTAGFNARIKHPYYHYIIKLKINGKVYWCDNRSTKQWNTVWEGRTSESESNITNGVYING